LTRGVNLSGVLSSPFHTWGPSGNCHSPSLHSLDQPLLTCPISIPSPVNGAAKSYWRLVLWSCPIEANRYCHDHNNNQPHPKLNILLQPGSVSIKIWCSTPDNTLKTLHNFKYSVNSLTLMLVQYNHGTSRPNLLCYLCTECQQQ